VVDVRDDAEVADVLHWNALPRKAREGSEHRSGGQAAHPAGVVFGAVGNEGGRPVLVESRTCLNLEPYRRLVEVLQPSLRLRLPRKTSGERTKTKRWERTSRPGPSGWSARWFGR
jgi:hypothetical protein